jgi:serine/threonine protein kinase
MNADKCDEKMKEYGFNEYERLLLSQHESVIQVYATTTTDNNSLIIVLDNAKNGDLRSFYEAKIEQYGKGLNKNKKWDPKSNKIGFQGIPSILPWEVINAADRMLMVFHISSALKEVHLVGLLHRDLKPENVLIDGDGWVKLADFGGTKEVATIDAGGN